MQIYSVLLSPHTNIPSLLEILSEDLQFHDKQGADKSAFSFTNVNQQYLFKKKFK